MRTRAVNSFIHRAGVIVALVLVALMLPVPAASAHDSVTGTNPEEGQALENIPAAVEITFTNPPIALGSQIVVKGADGKDWAVGDVEIVDNVATQAISPDAPDGQYTVTWRVVSSDSHPIEGVFEFTAGSGDSVDAEGSAAPEQDQPETAAAGEQDQPETAAAGEPEQSETAAAAAEEPETGQSGSAFPASFIIVLSVVLVALAVFMGVLARRRLKRD